MIHSRLHHALESMKAGERPALVNMYKHVANHKLFLVDMLLLQEDELVSFGVELAKQGLFRLPFNNTVLECYNCKQYGITADRIFIWCSQSIGAAFDKENKLHELEADETQLIMFCGSDHGDNIGFYSGTLSQHTGTIERPEFNFFIFLDEQARNDTPKEEVNMIAEDMNRTVAAFVALINSKSAEVTEQGAPEKLNKARAKKGKVLLPAVRFVDVPSRHQPLGAGSGTHASPRLHWRRGHLRHLPDKIVPVSPCLVGSADNGVVQQIYRARLLTEKSVAADVARALGV